MAVAKISRRTRLEQRLALATILVLLLSGAVGGFIMLTEEQETLESAFEDTAFTQGEVVRAFVDHEMRDNRREHIQDALTEVAQRNSVEEIVLINSAGKIAVATDLSSLGKTLTDQDVLAVLQSGERAVRRSDQYHTEVLSVIIPVFNKPECFTCHDTKQRILGAIELGLDRKPIDEHLRRQLWITLVTGSSTLLVAGGALFYGVRKSIVEPVSKTLEGTVRALSSTAASRDPYTARHQQYVSELASAIARELGLSGWRAEGIRTAGLLHDIGKIHIPAEILSKPARLSQLEMDLVKAHPQISHDVLKTIDFPWPVSEMVLEHHERLDGSGYPRGLIGKEISLEGKILAVADVVAAMVSHRPYRPAISLGKALEEISSGKEALYDGAVVDACLRLFYEKGFKFA